MKDVENIKERLARANEKRKKLEETLERHKVFLEKKQAAFISYYGEGVESKDDDFFRTNPSANMERFTIESRRRDIESVERKISDVDKSITSLTEELNAAEAAEAVISDDIPQEIKDFFEQWKQDCIDFYLRNYDEYVELSDKLRDKSYNAMIEAVKTLPAYAQYADRAESMTRSELVNLRPYKPMADYLAERHLDRQSIDVTKNSIAAPLTLVMQRYRDPDERLDYLQRTMEHEKKQRLFDLVQRVGKIVGKITAGHNLVVVNGEIAGIIEGEKGRASIQTIGAGGYNIQRYHFRTLVKEV